MRFLIMISIISLLVSCGMGEEEKGTPVKEIEDRSYLLDLYTSLKGEYEGYVKSRIDSENIPVSINIFILESEAGKNENGEPIFIPILKARYKRLDDMGKFDEQTLNVKYFKESGEIILVSSSSSIPVESIISLKGTLIKNELKCELTRGKGVTGDLNAKKISSTPNADNMVQEIYDREKLKRILSPLEGTYIGRVKNAFIKNENGNEEPFEYDAKIIIYLVEEHTGYNSEGEPQFTPNLKARFKRLDSFIGVLDFFLTVRYYKDTNEIVMGTGPGNDPKASVHGNGFFSIKGKIVKGNIHAHLASHIGKFGDLIAVKQK